MVCFAQARDTREIAKSQAGSKSSAGHTSPAFLVAQKACFPDVSAKQAADVYYDVNPLFSCNPLFLRPMAYQKGGMPIILR